MLPDTEIMTRWTTTRPPNCTKKTWVMALLENPEHHAIIRIPAMQMGEKGSNMYLVTKKWVTTSVVGSTEEPRASV